MSGDSDRPRAGGRAPASAQLGPAGNRAVAVALRLLAKPRTEAELRERLRAKGISADEAEQAVARCCAWGYVNDDEYSRQLCADLAAHGYGPFRARQKLKQRGFRPELVEGAISAVYGEREEELIAAFLPRFRPRLERTKRAQALARRGFSLAAVARALRLEDQLE